MERPVLLVFPRAEPDWPDPDKLLGLPLAVLTLARGLVAAGFRVVILDENVLGNTRAAMERVERPLFVGISVLGGYTIRSGLAVAELAARLWSGVPRVFGGWNPTLLPHLYEAPEAARWVDLVVRGRGEATAVELARRLADGRDLVGLPGLSWRDADGTLHREEEAPLDDPTDAGSLPYELVDPSRYLTRNGAINFVSSYGCPHRCGFCGIPAYTRTFRTTATDRVADELARLAAGGVGTVVFLDDNFFTSRERVLALADAFLARGTGIEWHSNGRIDQVLALDESELARVAASGCRGVNVGWETGSQAVADAVSKDVRVDDIFELAGRFRRAGIHLSLNVMVGLPDERLEDLFVTLDQLHRVHAEQPDLEVCWYLYMPAPGTPLWKRLVDEGRLSEPRTLREHARLQPLYLEHPWYYVSPPRAVFREWRTRHKQVVWTFWIAYAAPEPEGRVRRALFRVLRRRCRRAYESRRFGRGWAWRAAFFWNAVRDRARWTWRRLLRTRALHRLGDRWRDRTEPGRTFVLVAGTHRST